MCLYYGYLKPIIGIKLPKYKQFYHLQMFWAIDKRNQKKNLEKVVWSNFGDFSNVSTSLSCKLLFSLGYNGAKDLRKADQQACIIWKSG